MKQIFNSIVNYVNNIERLGNGMRIFFAVSGSIQWLGIWLTGFEVVHWVMYIPPISFTFAVITRICPGKILSEITANLLFGKKTQATSTEN